MFLTKSERVYMCKSAMESAETQITRSYRLSNAGTSLPFSLFNDWKSRYERRGRWVVT